MKFSSIYAIGDEILFRAGDSRWGVISEVIASEVGPRSYGIFYTVETADGAKYSVEEITLEGTAV